jgi:hypothetical protein
MVSQMIVKLLIPTSFDYVNNRLIMRNLGDDFFHLFGL